MRRLAIWLTAATIVTSLVLALMTPKHADPLPDGVTSPVLAAELVKDAAAILSVYGGSEKFRSDLEANIMLDFFFIASYGSMFFVMGRIAGGMAGLVISAAAVIAAMADVVENIGILRTIHGAAVTDALALSTRGPSLVKWGLLALVFWLTGWFWINQRGRVWYMLAGLFYLLAGAALLWGLFRPANMTWVWPPLGLAITIQLVVLMREGETTKS